MSSFIKRAINPKTGEPQDAAFIDDFYGHYEYGVGFLKDGSDFRFGVIGDEHDINFFDWYTPEDVETLP